MGPKLSATVCSFQHIKGKEIMCTRDCNFGHVDSKATFTKFEVCTRRGDSVTRFHLCGGLIEYLATF